MIITRSPLRISLGGGGTDLPSYYRQHGGFVVSAAINRYVYITIHQAFRPYIMLKYSKLEEVESVDQIVHPIIREALKRLQIPGPHLEIVSISDIPAGTRRVEAHQRRPGADQGRWRIRDTRSKRSKQW